MCSADCNGDVLVLITLPIGGSESGQPHSLEIPTD